MLFMEDRLEPLAPLTTLAGPEAEAGCGSMLAMTLWRGCLEQGVWLGERTGNVKKELGVRVIKEKVRVYYYALCVCARLWRVRDRQRYRQAEQAERQRDRERAKERNRRDARRQMEKEGGQGQGDCSGQTSARNEKTERES